MYVYAIPPKDRPMCALDACKMHYGPVSAAFGHVVYVNVRHVLFVWALDMFCFYVSIGYVLFLFSWWSVSRTIFPQSALQQIPAARQEYLACKQTEALRCRPTSLGCDATTHTVQTGSGHEEGSCPLSWIGSNASDPWWTSKFDQWSVCLPSHAAFCHMAVCGSPASQN